LYAPQPTAANAVSTLWFGNVLAVYHAAARHGRSGGCSMGSTKAWVAMLCLAMTAAHGTPSYTSTVVEPPAPYAAVFPARVNDGGDFVATLAALPDLRIYKLWTRDSGFIDIPVPGGGLIGAVTGLNNARQLIGVSSAGAFMWSPSGGWTTIAPAPGYTHPQPAAINESGRVVGYVFEDDGLMETADKRRTFVWTAAAGMQVLKPDAESVAAAVDRYGRIAGTVYFSHPYASGSKAVFVDGHRDALQIDGPSSFYGDDTVAVDINDSGMVAGDHSFSGDGAFVWTRRDGYVPVPSSTQAVGLDNEGNVLASGYPGGTFTSLLWRTDYGVVRLQDTIQPGGPRCNEPYGSAISSGGTIAGTCPLLQGRGYSALLLVPVR
jgi:hypothetical protein